MFKYIFLFFCFFIFLSNSVFGNSSSPNSEKQINFLERNIKDSIVNIKESYYTDGELYKEYDEIGDTMLEIIELKGNNYSLDDISWEGKNSKYASFTNNKTSSSLTLDTGDILVVKGLTKPWWCLFSDKYCHAAIVDGTNVLQALEPGKNSARQSLSDFLNYYSTRAEKIIIVKMNLTSSQKLGMEYYMDNNLVGIPYPSYYNILNSKYSMNTFYCSSLVWRAHYDSGKFIDLDEATSSSIVHPIELVTSSNAGTLYSITF